MHCSLFFDHLLSVYVFSLKLSTIYVIHKASRYQHVLTGEHDIFSEVDLSANPGIVTKNLKSNNLGLKVDKSSDFQSTVLEFLWVSERYLGNVHNTVTIPMFF